MFADTIYEIFNVSKYDNDNLCCIDFYKLMKYFGTQISYFFESISSEYNLVISIATNGGPNQRRYSEIFVIMP